MNRRIKYSITAGDIMRLVTEREKGDMPNPSLTVYVDYGTQNIGWPSPSTVVLEFEFDDDSRRVVPMREPV